MTIEYSLHDLFAAPPGAVLAHACNARGVWGTGVALGFARSFPDARKQYERECRKAVRDCAGQTFLLRDNHTSRLIACLITSKDYGDRRDSERAILRNTRLALVALERHLATWEDPAHQFAVYLPRINSGMFAVPWEKTERILKEEIGDLPRRYVICTPERKGKTHHEST